MIRCAAAEDAPRLIQIIQRSEESTGRPVLRKLFRQHQEAVWADTDTYKMWTGSNHLYVYDDGIIKGMIGWEQSDPVCEKRNAETCCYSDLCCFEKYGSCSVEILGIYVDPEFRGRGIGKRIMESFLKNMQYQDVRCADMWILDDDTESARFCSDFGFAQTTEEKKLPEGVRLVKYIRQYF